MRIDLISNRVAVLRIHGMVESQHDLVAVAKEMVPDGHGGDNFFVAVGGYRRSGTAHRLSVDVHSHDDRQHLEIVYECPAVRGESLHDPPRSVLRITRQLESLFSSEQFVGISSELHCDAMFQHSVSEVSTIIPLPMLSVSDPALPFSAVTGVRFEKREGDSHKYSVVLTRSQRRDALICDVQFHAVYKNNTGISHKYMADAVIIAHDFITSKGISDAAT